VLNQTARHEDVCGCGGIAPRLLNIGNRWRWVVGFMSQALCPRGRAPANRYRWAAESIWTRWWRWKIDS